MDNKKIISEINHGLHEISKLLVSWLSVRLSYVSDMWWEDMVIPSLSVFHKKLVKENNIKSLQELDLVCLLHIARKNWTAMRSKCHLSTHEQELFDQLREVRNLWAHCGVSMLPKDTIISNIDTMINCAEILNGEKAIVNNFRALQSHVQNSEFEQNAPILISRETKSISTIQKGNKVGFHSNLDKVGLVTDITNLDTNTQYNIFVDGEFKNYYEEQIFKITETSTIIWDTKEELKAYLTAKQIKTPNNSHLYSLNSARIDFVPYQFRPALKILKADLPRLLIADSVGVGKTIEAGLILKELSARDEDFESVLIICPKPLVAERKWELEMQRFDERFTQMDGPTLRQAIDSAYRDGEWPDRHKKTIIPYSLLDTKILEGDKKKKHKGLMELDPQPTFDLIIIDEAHHIRNANTQAYEVVKFLCDNAKAVVMLTATPIQMGDKDLYTLLNLLRPDIIVDRQTFEVMANPNQYINSAIKEIKSDNNNSAHDYLHKAALTQWGGVFIAKNPIYTNALNTLKANSEISLEEKLTLIKDIESMHSFANLINRTRREDIGEFCIRKTQTVEVEFTGHQKDLHDSLIDFEASALSILRGNSLVKFMISMMRRQAASCIFGLAPFMENLINRRMDQLFDEYEHDFSERDLSDSSLFTIADEIIAKSKSLPNEDPKLASMLKVIEDKQKEENNKIIIFSTFRATLNYLYSHLKDKGFRVAMINGSVKDEDRLTIRKLFEKDKTEPDAVDVLLFTEVGCEGLDYQFCDTMINYDLPWNPMKIEQRIGRIDRRGQKSEAVNIINIITNGTLDAEIYNRCLLRIGVFESSIGECSDILSDISKKIEDIAISSNLTEEEKKIKLSKLTENEVRNSLEIKKLEDEQKQLFGFDLSQMMMDKEVSDAENPCISADYLKYLVESFLNSKLGEKQYILGEREKKSLRLDSDARKVLFDDFKKLSLKENELTRLWRSYLRGNNPHLPITFDQSIAEQERDVHLLSIVHPLLKQAADYIVSRDNCNVALSVNGSDCGLKVGEYPFYLEQWTYTGVKSQAKIMVISELGVNFLEFINIMEMSVSNKDFNFDLNSVAFSLSQIKSDMWTAEKTLHKQLCESISDYRKEAFENNYIRRKSIYQTQMNESTDEKLYNMRKGQLNKLEQEKAKFYEMLENNEKRTDIDCTTFVKGVLVVE